MLSTNKSGSTTVLRARVRVGGDTETLIASNVALSTNIWHHAAATFDGDIFILYLDGQQVASTPLSGAVDIDPTINVAVGSQPDGGKHFDGLIDDVRILQRALAESEIQDLVAGNDAPVANAESYTATEDLILNVDTQNGVLVNDVDPNNQLMTAEIFTDAENGSVTLNDDGSFIYIPDPDFFGTDSFSYRASDGTVVSNDAIVTIAVIAVNDPPVAADDAYQIAPDATLEVSAESLLDNDSDVESDPLQASLGGTDVASGSLTWIPTEHLLMCRIRVLKVLIRLPTM